MLPGTERVRMAQADMAGMVANIEACIPALRRYARALLRDPQEVDDLVHDCLVRALERLDTRRDGGDLRAWLFAILHNLFVSRVRRRKAHGGTQPIDAMTGDLAGPRTGQDLRVEAQDLIRAVDALPEEQRSVLLLVSVEDLTYAEVARILGIPIGTVMSRLARARERLARESGARPMLRRAK